MINVDRLLLLSIIAQYETGIATAQLKLILNQYNIELSQSALNFALFDLAKKGYLECVARSVYRITRGGVELLSRYRGLLLELWGTKTPKIAPIGNHSTPPSVQCKAENETELAEELSEIWKWVSNKSKIKSVIQKLVQLRECEPAQVKTICARIWGAPEEIPAKLVGRFERAVEDTLELLESRKLYD
jgi:DNA-binding PadR family transcriptional regulator